MDSEAYDRLVIAIGNDLPVNDELTATMDAMSSEELLQLLSDVTNLPMQAWMDALARHEAKASREHIAALEAENAQLRARLLQGEQIIREGVEVYDRLRAACEPIRDNLAAAEWSSPEEAERILESIINGYWPALRVALAEGTEQ